MKRIFFRLRRAPLLLAMVSVSLLSHSAIADGPECEDPPELDDVGEPITINSPGSLKELACITGDEFKTTTNAIFLDLKFHAECGGWNERDCVAGVFGTSSGCLVGSSSSTSTGSSLSSSSVTSTSLSSSSRGKIAKVWGLPGRRPDPLGNIPSGMAKRIERGGALDDGYTFPSIPEVTGFTTSCDAGNPPYLKDPLPCAEDGQGDEDEFDDDKATPPKCKLLCARLNYWQAPVWYCDEEQPAPPGEEPEIKTKWYQGKECERGDGSGDEQEEGAEAYSCSEVYDFEDVKDSPGIAPDGPDEPCDSEVGWVFDGWYYACSAQKVSSLNYYTVNDKAHADARRNCLVCNGDGLPDPAKSSVLDNNSEALDRTTRNETGCRAGPDSRVYTDVGGVVVPGVPAVGKLKMDPGPYVSFFRHYKNIGYEREKQSPLDTNKRTNMQMACYGFYNEIDAKTQQSFDTDRHCVLSAYTSSNEFRQMYRTQRSKGAYAPSSAAFDPDPWVKQNLRNPDFDPDDEDKELWYPNLGRSFELHTKQLEEEFGGDPTFALLETSHMASSQGGSAGSRTRYVPYTVPAQMQATVQISTTQKLSSGSLVRAFDDTVKNETKDLRVFTEWWQEQQTQAQRLMDPRLIAIFPPTWSLDLAPLEKIFTPDNVPSSASSSSESDSDTPIEIAADRRREPIEVQLEIREDMLGEVADYLTRSLLLRITEEPVTVVVPVGANYREYKAAWLNWKKEREAAGETVPGNTDEIIEKLEEYAVRGDDVRKLRADLAKYAGQVLRYQEQITAKGIGLWLQENLEQYKEFQQKVKARQSLYNNWRQVEYMYRRFHDVTNMPWCKNDRFTTPVYTFLDDWLVGRPAISGALLPSLGLHPIPDAIVDFSALQTSTGSVRLPVLRPVQVNTDHVALSPPQGDTPKNHEYETCMEEVGDTSYCESVYGPPFQFPELPDLPPIPKIFAFDFLPYLSEDNVKATRIKTYFPEDIDNAKTLANMIEIAKMIGGMDNRYEKFWNALTKPKCGTVEGAKLCEYLDNAEDCCVETGEELFCNGVDTERCVLTEIDGKEWLTRAGARLGILLQEDFKALGAFRTLGTVASSSVASAGVSTSASASSSSPRPEFPPCNPKDWACLQLDPRETLPREGVYIIGPSDHAQQEKLEKLRIQMFRKTLQRPDDDREDLWPYDRPRNDLLPTFNVPPEILLRSTRSSSSSS